MRDMFMPLLLFILVINMDEYYENFTLNIITYFNHNLF